MVSNWYLDDKIGVPWNVSRKVFKEAWLYHKRRGATIRIYKCNKHKTLYELIRESQSVCWFIGQH